MRLVRVRTDDGVILDRYDDDAAMTDGEEYEIGVDAELLAPCDLAVFYCVGRNYAVAVDQMGYDIPDQSDWLIESPVSVLDPDADTEHPDWTSELTYVGELAAAIDRECSDVVEEDVDEVIRGYTILNDPDAFD